MKVLFVKPYQYGAVLKFPSTEDLTEACEFFARQDVFCVQLGALHGYGRHCLSVILQASSAQEVRRKLRAAMVELADMNGGGR